MNDSAIRIVDDFLSPEEQQAVWLYMLQPGWSFGAFSDNGPMGSRYFYKHYAGYQKDGAEGRDADAIEAELASHEVLAKVWARLKAGPLAGHALGRCYANGMPAGAEGGLHMDSNIESHLTAIYYPHPRWHPALGGETLFFNKDGSDVIGAVYPRPNRLAIFPGTIPHVARPMSAKAKDLRITLMFKCGPASTAVPAGEGARTAA